MTLPNHDHEPIIKVLWLSGDQSLHILDGKYQFIAVTSGLNIDRYVEWLVKQQNGKKHWIIISPSSGISADPKPLWICFIAHSDPAEFKDAKALAILFKGTWHDKHWKNGLEPAL